MNFPGESRSAQAGAGWLEWRRHMDAHNATRAQDLLVQALAAEQERDWPRAESIVREAIRLAPRDPRCHQALGNLFSSAGRSEDSLHAYEQALSQAPGSPEVLNNLGTAWQMLANWQMAGECFEAALEGAPDLAAAHANLGMLRLLQGDYDAGWQHYEWRLRLDGESWPSGFPNGDFLGGPGSVTLDAEQGLGDTLQMARLAGLLTSRGFSVRLRCHPRLVPLLSLARLAADVRPLDDDGTDDGMRIPLMSLPRILGVRADTIPCSTPYLRSDPARVIRWRRELEPIRGLRVAIVWQGNPDAPHDLLRSIPLTTFAPLALPGVSLISLQQGFGSEQIAAADTRHLPVFTLGKDVDADGAFLDSAAILRNVDLVLCCDTAVAHLAGALDVPTWIALPESPHWPWLLERSDSPWYPSVRLFRQPCRGDWSAVFRRMAQELAAVLHSHGGLELRAPGNSLPPTRPITRTKHGWMLAFPNDVYVGRSLMRYGEYSEEEAQLLCATIAPGDTVVEAGAHIGALTLPLAQRVGPTGRVIAFEPQPALFRMLCANLALNDLSNVTCRQAGAGECDGALRLPDLDYGREGNFGGVSLEVDASGESVPVRAIDSLGLRDCHLIKIDVEGMEASVLRGARDTIERCRPILYVEADRADTTPESVCLIREYGYRLHLHMPPLVRGKATAVPDAGDGHTLVSVNLLCVPKEMEDLAFDLPELEGDDDGWRRAVAHGRKESPDFGSLPLSSPRLSLPTTPGELLDRLTVLELKSARLPDPAARVSADVQRAALEAVTRALSPMPPDAVAAIVELRTVNAALWDAEDAIRICEANGVLGGRFVELSRTICRLNDKRAGIKTRLNAIFNAPHNDDKCYGGGPGNEQATADSQ